MELERVPLGDLMKTLDKAGSVTNGWDILYSLDINSLNTALERKFQEHPEYSEQKIHHTEHVFGEILETKCDLKFGRPFIRFSHVQSGIYELHLPIKSSSVCTRTFQGNQVRTVIPERHNVVISAPLKARKGTNEEVLFLSHEPIELGDDDEQATVVLPFGHDVRKISIQPEATTKELNGLFETIANSLGEKLQVIHYDLVKIVKTSNDTLTPKTLLFTTTSAENTPEDGVLNLWIKTNETDSSVGNSMPSFYPNRGVLPVPKHHSSSVYFSKKLIEKTYDSNSTMETTKITIDFEPFHAFASNNVLLNEETFKVGGDKGIYFAKDAVIVRDVLPHYSEMTKATSRSRVQKKCHDLSQKFEVRGKFVRMSDVNYKACPKEIKFVEIFALEKFFMDTDFLNTCNKIQLSVVAPNWEILGYQNVKVSGAVLGIAENFMGDDGLIVSAPQQNNIRMVGTSKNHSITSTTLDDTMRGIVPEKSFVGVCTFKTAPIELQNCTTPQPCAVPQDGAQNFINPSYAVNNYKNYARENLGKREQKFIDQIEANGDVQQLYDTLGYINELFGLENQFYKLQNKIPFVPFYASLLRRLEKYAAGPKDYEKSVQYKKVLSHIYTATLSKICSLNSDSATSLVIDLEKYLDVAMHNINQWKDLSSNVAIRQYNEKYQKDLQAKVDEAKFYIDAQVMNAVDKVFDETENKIQILVDETVALQNKTQEDIIRLEKAQDDLRKAFVIRALLSSVKISSQFLAFLGPVGAATGSAIGGASMVAETLILDDASASGQDKIATLPTSVRFSVVKIMDEYKYRQTMLKYQLQDATNRLNEFLQEEPAPTIQELHTKINAAKVRLDAEIAKGDDSDPEVVTNIRKEVGDLLENKKGILEKQKPNNEIKIDKQLRIVMHVQNVVSITEVTLNSYSKLRNDKAKIDMMGKRIKETEQELEQLKQYEENIYKIIKPTCKNMLDNMKKIEKQMENKSHATLEIGKWNIQSTLRDLKLKLKQMTQGFKVQENIMRCIEKMEETMTTMISLYDRIQDYHDKSQLAAYIADINSAKALSIKTDNRELNTALDTLNKIIKSNLILEQYEKAMTAFKYFIFPFAHLYLQQFALPPSIKIEDDVDGLVLNAVTQIEHIKVKIGEVRSVIEKYDSYIHRNIEFNNANQVTSAFIVWNHEQYQDSISNLLEGKEVTIKADILRGLSLNAVKFKVVGINFKARDQNVQKALDDSLEKFAVTMTHSGNSYYRCDSKFYVIKGDKQPIYYHMKWKNGRPLNTNAVYDKIKNGDYMLSPYTTWTIQLSNVSATWDVLQKYKSLPIDLELEGVGQYVDMGIKVCNRDLNNYYKQDDTIVDPTFNFIRNKRAIREIKKRSNRVVEEKLRSPPLKLREKYYTSSAGGIGSPINNAINWIGSKLQQLNPFSTKTNHIGQSSDYLTPTTTVADFNTNSALILGDFAIRALTKSKYYNSTEKPIDFIDVKGQALNILEEYEKIVDSSGANVEFDPVTLMSKIEKEIINGDVKNLGKILYNDGEDSFKDKIDEMLHKESTKFNVDAIGSFDINKNADIVNNFNVVY